MGAFFSIGMSVVSVHYYLKIVKVMYFGDESKSFESIKVTVSTKVVLTLSMIVLVIFGIYPTQLINLVMEISKTFLS
ncbi:hypothetical protein [Clostridium fungisolvens]|uniref:NAD(P)H-quinone oxidoreductase subunit 2, chloroplastic n=1 Tax=Clostridium fungisolvens TaxID=1604897 RepID=A0A6V8SEU9_9CLOT|nr:hypothetical protein [Clostridium fungisolvens]GFP75727.1 NAD(P)H-quinone oxidoreductase subunit 2, chloroplastic [Clostridium fungisolvens]